MVLLFILEPKEAQTVLFAERFALLFIKTRI